MAEKMMGFVFYNPAMLSMSLVGCDVVCLTSPDTETFARVTGLLQTPNRDPQTPLVLISDTIQLFQLYVHWLDEELTPANRSILDDVRIVLYEEANALVQAGIPPRDLQKREDNVWLNTQKSLPNDPMWWSTLIQSIQPGMKEGIMEAVSLSAQGAGSLSPADLKSMEGIQNMELPTGDINAATMAAALDAGGQQLTIPAMPTASATIPTQQPNVPTMPPMQPVQPLVAAPLAQPLQQPMAQPAQMAPVQQPLQQTPQQPVAAPVFPAADNSVPPFVAPAQQAVAEVPSATPVLDLITINAKLDEILSLLKAQNIHQPNIIAAPVPETQPSGSWPAPGAPEVAATGAAANLMDILSVVIKNFNLDAAKATSYSTALVQYLVGMCDEKAWNKAKRSLKVKSSEVEDYIASNNSYHLWKAYQLLCMGADEQRVRTEIPVVPADLNLVIASFPVEARTFVVPLDQLELVGWF